MKNLIWIILLLIITSCSSKIVHNQVNIKNYIFLSSDENETKFQYLETVKNGYNSGKLMNSPVVAIDGIVLNYDKTLDTIILPIKVKDVTSFQLLHKNSSAVIYGKKETNGAIIINTTNLK